MTTRAEPIPETGAFRTRGHVYYHNGEGPWPGVTGITDVLDKPALTYWKREQVALAAIDHAERLLEDRVAGNVDAAVSYLLKSRDAGTDGRDRGTRIHTAIEGILRRENPIITEVDQPAVEGARAWLNQQVSEHGLKVLEVESFVLNPTVGYGGTVDLIAEIDGEVWILDWKSGKTVADRSGKVYREMRLQLAAYSNSEFIGRPADATRYPLPPITRHGIVHVTDGGTRLYDAQVTEQDWIAFRACLYVHGWAAAA